MDDAYANDSHKDEIGEVSFPPNLRMSSMPFCQAFWKPGVAYLTSKQAQGRCMTACPLAVLTIENVHLQC